MLRLKDLNPYERHKLLINEYILNQPGSTKLLQRDTSRDKRDIDVIRENHKFLWNDEEADTWEKQLTRKYYDKLFKEYCISDLSRFKENKIALRWRVEKEVISGKGQFVCGNKICNQTEGLRSWEVNFAYQEQNEKKNALVKLRLCPDCSLRLNYRSKKREVKRIKKSCKKKHKKKDVSKTKDAEIVSEDSSTSENDEKLTKEDVDRVSDSELANSDDEREREANFEKEIEKQAENIWANRKEDAAEPSREQEFENYLEDLLL